MFEDKTFVTKARALRPFYFIVVVWGKRYIDFFFNFCIASLLSPNNIPTLLNSGNKFLIATTEEDWGKMQSRPIFKLLKKYVEPVFLCIPPCPPETINYMHSGIGHKLATQMAFEDRAYGVVLVPDQIVSDGTLAAVQRHAVDGYNVVLTAWLRFGEEPLFEHLKKMEIVSFDSCFGDEARPLIVTGRQMVSAGIRSFHSEVLVCEWGKAFFSRFEIGVWWRVPTEEGIILHSINWAPLLIDYDAVKHHDASTMDNAAIDGDYVHRNFGLNSKVHVVQDSDEMMLVSFGPLNNRPQSLEPQSQYARRFFGEWERGALMYEGLHNPAWDPLKWKIFTRPVYWHASDINQEIWSATEKHAMGIIRKYALAEGIFGHVVLPLIVKYRNFEIRHTAVYRFFRLLLLHINFFIKVIARRVGLALIGDRTALHWWRWRLRKLLSNLIGRPFQEIQPPTP